MLNFKPLSLDDKELIDKYIYPYKFYICDFSFIDLFMWRKLFDIQYCIFDDTLLIRKKDINGSFYFLQPIGYRYDNLKTIMKTLEENKDSPEIWLIKYAEFSFIKDLTSILPEKYLIVEDRDNFDYIYETEKLISLSGNLLCKKRNNYNHFVKNNNYSIKLYSEKLLSDCLFILTNWYKNCIDKDYLYYEIEAVKDLLLNFSKLNFQCLIVYIDKIPYAFSIGEIINENMAIIHIEKADKSIRGLYSFINKKMCEIFYNNIPYINREEDLGLIGLRKAKMSYNPLWLEKKFLIKIN